MYKTKLQELCQQKKWALPKYSSMKDGPDHLPQFKASVSVNGLLFNSVTCCKSSKDAHNNAAMLAFLHFASSEFSAHSVEHEVGGVPKTEETYEGPAIQSDAKTTIGEFVSDDLDFVKDSKEAEHAAAKGAFTFLSLDCFQKDESGPYKNLLKEFAKRECLCMPTYKTTKSGAHRTPTFFSTVEVEGEMFHGKAGKSVRQAELSAAMVAYKSLVKRESTWIDEHAAHNMNEAAPKNTSSSKVKVNADSIQNVKDEVVLTPCPALISQAYSERRKEKSHVKTEKAQLAEKCPPHAKLSIGNCSSFPKVKTEETITIRTPFPCSDSVPSLEEVLMSPKSTLPNLPASSSSNVGNVTGLKSYLLCNKIRVYTEFPDCKFPEGISVLPIAEDKWVAVGLETSN